MKYDVILRIISSDGFNHDDIGNGAYKEKQQLYSLLNCTNAQHTIRCMSCVITRFCDIYAYLRR